MTALQQTVHIRIMCTWAKRYDGRRASLSGRHSISQQIPSGCYNGSCVEKLKLLGFCLISPSEASWEIEESENYSGELLIKPSQYQGAI